MAVKFVQKSVNYLIFRSQKHISVYVWYHLCVLEYLLFKVLFD